MKYFIEYNNIPTARNIARTIETDSPGSKRKIPAKVAYMIWQVSPDMPDLHF